MLQTTARTTPCSGGTPREDLDGPVVVGLSGGVDSAVALALLQREGVPVRALFMKNWDEDDGGPCPAEADLEMARRVCDRLGVELGTVNFSYEYWERVFTRFVDEHAAGRTPNPDVLCNREVKFDAFALHALDLGARAIATGHYARLVQRGGRYRLLRGVDGAKDQTYFLHTLDQAQLARSHFPIGRLTKRAVREIARDLDLAPHDRKDSTGICFIGERPFRAFLERYVPPAPGLILDVDDGQVVGEHQGLAFYTIGQRQGLAIGGRRGGSGAPWYVAGKDGANGALLVAQGRDHAALHARALRTRPVHWIAGATPPMPLRCHARIRHRQPEQACTVAPGDDGCIVTFDEAQWAVAPGQSAVFYAGDECLGGGVIEQAVAGTRGDLGAKP